MKCCRCNCSFAKCIEEHKKDLNKEFNQLIIGWMKEHPEVKNIYLRDNSLCLTTNSIFIYPDRKYTAIVHFE